MHLKWLEDVIAVARAASLTEAANARRVTQPAFSRRLRALEDWLGTEIVDRSHKAASLTPVAHAHLEQIETLVRHFHRLRDDIALWRRHNGSLALVAQHSLATTVLPRLVVCLGRNQAIAEVRVQAADLPECHALLMDGGADILIAYETASDSPFPNENADHLTLATDRLIPVVASGVMGEISRTARHGGVIDVVSYPKAVFFGSVLHRHVLPALKDRNDIRIRCETALASGVMEMVLAGLGVGWVPRLLAGDKLDQGHLIDLSDMIGHVPLFIVATRLRSTAPGVADTAWGDLASFAETRDGLLLG